MVEAVVIGASAGAIEVLSSLLPALPAQTPFPVVVVVHVPPDRPSVLAEIFGPKCKVAVKEVEDKESLAHSCLYFAPPDYHILIEEDRRLSLSHDEVVHFSRPSIDVLFESAADVFGEGLVGIVLTGANTDGANGLRAICEAGGIALVQEPETAFCSTMPLAALDACPGAQSLTMDAIGEYLIRAAEEGNVHAV